jgi:hypothetical protein
LGLGPDFGILMKIAMQDLPNSGRNLMEKVGGCTKKGGGWETSGWI